MSWGSTWAFLFNYNKFISSYSSQVTPFSYSVSTTSPPVIVCTTTATSICHLQRLFQPTINSSTNIFSSNNYHHIGININTCTVIPSTVNLQYYPPYWHWTTDTGTVASPIYDTVKCLLSIHSCQMLNVPWYKSSSTFSSKFSDSWKYYYFKKYSSSTQCPSSLLWTHWLANNEGPFTDRWRTWRM